MKEMKKKREQEKAGRGEDTEKETRKQEGVFVPNMFSKRGGLVSYEMKFIGPEMIMTIGNDNMNKEISFRIQM